MHHEVSILTVIKNLGYIPAVFIGLSTESYTILTIFMFIDILTGIARSGILHGWRSITSFKLISGLITKLLVLIIPLLLVWAGKGAGVDLLFLAQGTLGLLIFAQLYSIIGNIYAVKTKEDIHEFDAVALVLNNLKRIIERVLVDSGKGSK